MNLQRKAAISCRDNFSHRKTTFIQFFHNKRCLLVYQKFCLLLCPIRYFVHHPFQSMIAPLQVHQLNFESQRGRGRPNYHNFLSVVQKCERGKFTLSLRILCTSLVNINTFQQGKMHTIGINISKTHMSTQSCIFRFLIANSMNC